jgi:hypothetical protein
MTVEDDVLVMLFVWDELPATHVELDDPAMVVLLAAASEGPRPEPPNAAA